MTTEQQNIERWNATRIPFASHLGLTIARMAGGKSEMHYAPAPEHLNTFDVTHGGATMTLLDVTMAAAARSVEPDMGAVTIEMKTTFMQPARGRLVARAELLHRTRSMAFLQASVFDADERLCSQATGTFRFVRPAAPPGQAGDTVPTDTH